MASAAPDHLLDASILVEDFDLNDDEMYDRSAIGALAFGQQLRHSQEQSPVPSPASSHHDLLSPVPASKYASGGGGLPLDAELDDLAFGTRPELGGGAFLDADDDLLDSPLDSSSFGSSSSRSSPGTQAHYSEGPSWLPRFLTTLYWAPYFDFSTKKIQARVVRAMLPVYSEPFFRSPRDHPDLYAPFWLTTSLVVVLAVSGNLASYLEHEEDDKWKASFDHLAFAASVFYGWLFLAPVLVYLGFMWIGTHKPLAELISLYGYALAVWLPTSMLLLVPSNLLRLSMSLLSAVLSAVFLVRNLAVGTIRPRFVTVEAEDDGLELDQLEAGGGGSPGSSAAENAGAGAAEIVYDPQDHVLPRESRAQASLVLAAAFVLQLLLGLVIKINFFPKMT